MLARPSTYASDCSDATRPLRVDVAPSGNHTEGMRSHDSSAAVPTLAPLLLLAGVGIVILSQLWSVVPMAAGVALAGWGSALAIPPQRRVRSVLVLAVYVPLVALAMGAQLDAASAGSLVRRFLTAMDAGAAGGLMALLVRRAIAR
jgi:hypothetical protein